MACQEYLDSSGEWPRSYATGIPALTLIGSLWGWRTSLLCITGLNAVLTIFLVRSIRRDKEGVESFESPPLNPGAYAWMLADMATVLLISSTLLRESSIWGFYTFRGAFFVETFRVGSQHIRVDSGRGQNRTLRLLLALGHRYPLASRIWAHPRGEMWAKISDSTVSPVCFRCLTVSDRFAEMDAFRWMTMVARRLSPAMW